MIKGKSINLYSRSLSLVYFIQGSVSFGEKLFFLTLSYFIDFGVLNIFKYLAAPL